MQGQHQHSSKWPIRYLAVSLSHEQVLKQTLQAFSHGLPASWPKPEVLVFYKRIPRTRAYLAWSGEAFDPVDAQTKDRLREVYDGEVETIEVTQSNLAFLGDELDPLFWVQDDFAWIEGQGDEPAAIHLRNDVSNWPLKGKINWPACWEPYYCLEPPTLSFHGGDVLILDRAVLAGPTAAIADVLKWPELPAERTKACFYPLRSKEGMDHQHSSLETGANKLIDELRTVQPQLTHLKYSFPFYHLDLCLTAIEYPGELVFFLGKIQKARNRQETLNVEYWEEVDRIGERLDGLIEALQAFGQHYQKRVTINRLPILMGLPYEGMQSLVNGLLLHDGIEGVYLVHKPMVHAPNVQLDQEEVNEAMEEVQRQFKPYAVKVIEVPVTVSFMNMKRGGLHCMMKGWH